MERLEKLLNHHLNSLECLQYDKDALLADKLRLTRELKSHREQAQKFMAFEEFVKEL